MLDAALDPLAATAERIYAWEARRHSETEDSLVLSGYDRVPAHAGSVKTSSSSRLVEENSVTTAPSGPARNQCSVPGGIVELLARAQHELAAVDPQRHEPAPAAEGLLLAGRAVEGRVAVLGARLAGVEHELLRAVAVGVDVDEQLQPRLAEAREAEVGDLDRARSASVSDDPRRLERSAAYACASRCSSG